MGAGIKVCFSIEYNAVCYVGKRHFFRPPYLEMLIDIRHTV